MVLENPGLPGESRITQSLFAGLQIILPGEIAPAHKHVASALRFIIEGHKAYTAVAGERTMMEPGDFVITPSMTWHDHGNESDAPMVWLDGLDMHIVNLLCASFREGYPGKVHPLDRPEGAAMAEAGHNLLPVDQVYTSQTSPIFNYPYRRTREALDQLARFRAADPRHAYKMKYINPVNGGWAMPTISTWMQLIPKGFNTAPYRSTDSAVFTVVEGTGRSKIGGETFDWGRTTFSSRRAGSRTSTAHRATPSCSSTRIGWCRRSWTSGGEKTGDLNQRFWPKRSAGRAIIAVARPLSWPRSAHDKGKCAYGKPAEALSVEQEELRGISRTVAEIEWLLLILVPVYPVFNGPAANDQAAISAGLFFYAAFVLGFRYTNSTNQNRNGKSPSKPL